MSQYFNLRNGSIFFVKCLYIVCLASIVNVSNTAETVEKVQITKLTPYEFSRPRFFNYP